MITYVMDSVKMLTTLSTIKWGYVKNPVIYAMQWLLDRTFVSIIMEVSSQNNLFFQIQL